MLKNLLNLVPTRILRALGDSSFAKLKERGEVETWIVFGKKQLLVDEDLIPGNYYYLGMQIRILYSGNNWEWFVYDGMGEQVVANAYAESENEAIESAQEWVDMFSGEGVENG